ncbi:MAG: UDP-N-acetylmuramate dehydrogenase [Saprospiraceae bacterium]
MSIQSNISLQPYNTFGIDAIAKQFLSIESISTLQKTIQDLQSSNQSVFILGGGSNILLKNDISALVLKMDLKGKSIFKKEENNIWVKAKAGENWHDFVLWTLQQNYYGLENLSLIPGTVGASPIQNIGAYGVELKDVFESLEAVHLQTGEIKTFNKEACLFGYRDSIFKNKLKGQFCIVSVTFKLSTLPTIRTDYGAIKTQLQVMEIPEKDWTPQAVSDAVIAIRSSKLPNPAEIGNSGSFFKNPEIPLAQFETLKTQFPHIVSYALPNNQFKIPAGWLIEQCGWKGKVVGNTGTYKHQALVLVNHGNATGEEIYNLSTQIIQSVKNKFGIELSREVNVVEC